MTPGVFLSYSTRDRAELENLLSALRRADEEVWFDEELGGGEVWWQKILERIRDCEVFVFALSNNSLQSKPCLTELRYAQALQKPVLPIQIGPVTSLRVTPLATVEAVDFRTPTVDSGIRLITAVQRAKQLAAPLPSPLPEEPPVPFGYLMRLATTIGGDELDAQQQAKILSELEAVVAQDGDGASDDIAGLLRVLHDRPDATETTRAETQRLLAALGSTATEATHPVAAQPKPGSRKWAIAAVSAVVVIAAAVAAVTLRHRPAPEPPAPQPTTVAAEPTETLPTVAPETVGSLLLSPAEITAATGVPNLVADPPDDSMFAPTEQLSDPDCLGADYAAAEPVYDGSGWSAVSVQTLTEPPPDDPDSTLFWFNQAAVSFPTERQAGDFLDRSAQHWRGCSGRVVKDPIGASPTSWTFGDLTRDKSAISQISFSEGGQGWACQHTLRAHSNAVLEAVVCGLHITDQATRIVDKMGEKAKG